MSPKFSQHKLSIDKNNYVDVEMYLIWGILYGLTV